MMIVLIVTEHWVFSRKEGHLVDAYGINGEEGRGNLR